MPAYVTGQTKVFKAYGKKQRTHTANLRQVGPLDLSQSSPDKGAVVKLSSDSDFSEAEDDYQISPPKQPLRTPAKKKQALAAFKAARLARPGGDGKENGVVDAGYARQSPKPVANNKLAQARTPPASRSLTGSPSKQPPPSEPVRTSSSKPAPLGLRRERPRSTFIGVVIDTRPSRGPRPATRQPSSESTPPITLSDDDPDPALANQSATGNRSWSKPSAADGGLSAKFGELDLSDSDSNSDCQVVPSPAERAQHFSASSAEVRSRTNVSRQGSKVSTKLEEAGSNQDDQVPSPAPPPAPLRASRHTRSASASASALAAASAINPPASRSASAKLKGPVQSRMSLPALLNPLLAITSAGSPSSGAFDFADFVRSPPAPLGPTSALARWRKVGEASFSEVFSAPGAQGEDLVVKIIPISPWAPGKAPKLKKDAEETPFMSECDSVEREVRLSTLLGGHRSQVDGFVKFKGAFLVQGNYPAALLAAWDEFKTAQSPPCDDQIRPHVLPARQTYMMIVLSHGGRDLESYKLKSWVEAASVLWQVAGVCARAEEAHQFEHRDLHWGNVLVQPVAGGSLSDRLTSLSVTPSKGAATAVPRLGLEPARSGVEVTLIDFTLSRALDGQGEGVLWDGFEDECVFEGEGDTQFDVYRSMRDHVRDDWEGFHPLTNLMWIHHLSTKLLTAKKLKKPTQLPSRLVSPAASSPARKGRSAAASLSGTPRRGLKPAQAKPASNVASEYEAWNVLKDVQKRLADALKEAAPAKERKGRKADAGWRSAGDFVAWWGMERERGV